jgi:hypothetical protein
MPSAYEDQLTKKRGGGETLYAPTRTKGVTHQNKCQGDWVGCKQSKLSRRGVVKRGAKGSTTYKHTPQEQGRHPSYRTGKGMCATYVKINTFTEEARALFYYD